MNSFTQLIQQIKSADYASANRTFAEIMQQKVDTRLDAERRTIFSESELSAGETAEKERLVKGMKKSSGDFEKRYPGRGKEVMYATATKMAQD